MCPSCGEGHSGDCSVNGYVGPCGDCGGRGWVIPKLRWEMKWVAVSNWDDAIALMEDGWEPMGIDTNDNTCFKKASLPDDIDEPTAQRVREALGTTEAG